MQTIKPAVMTSGSLEGDQIGDVIGNLDLFTFTPAARVGGNDLGAIDDAHTIEGGVHLDRAAHVGVRHRVVVEVEAHVGGAPERRSARSPHTQRDCRERE